jgi:AI-2 transport protein TqsA
MSTMNPPRGSQVLLVLAAFVIIVAGFRAAAELMVPVMLALFLSLLSLSPLRRLEQLGLPSVLAVAVVVTGVTLIMLLLSVVIGRSATEFQQALPLYQQRLDAVFRSALAWLTDHGVKLDPAKLLDRLDSASIMTLVGNTATGILAALSNVVLVILTMVFMLLEAQTLAGKLRSAMQDPQADLSGFTQAARQVQKYLAIKAWVSLSTGALAMLVCLGLGVDFPFLWGLLAFLFNFVPNIGPIIAALPPILLALIEHGVGSALLVLLGYTIISTVIGNMLEPRLMGRRLGLSTLVVFLSLLFWGWVWGPIGMLLSVPLTVVLKILLEHSEDFRWLAVLLGPGDEPPAPRPPVVEAAMSESGAGPAPP